jgi:hypothetical protein
MTRLPASEAAFASGQEETAPFLYEVMKGAPYSGFTGFLVINEMLKSIMSHVHLIKSSDRPEDAINGAFWQRHRRLDNQLSTLFLFMPESFRLPDNIRDPLATYINLNFHACVICLHHVALEKIETHQLDDSLRKECHSLLKNAAEEIASIAKLTSHRSSLFVRDPVSTLKYEADIQYRATPCAPSPSTVRRPSTCTSPNRTLPQESTPKTCPT